MGEPPLNGPTVESPVSPYLLARNPPVLNQLIERRLGKLQVHRQVIDGHDLWQSCNLIAKSGGAGHAAIVAVIVYWWNAACPARWG